MSEMASMPARLSSGGSAICQVPLTRNYTRVSMEDEYLPRVLWCEVGGEPRQPEMLKAHAIAARTFTYRRLMTKSPVPYMRTDTSDQVYSSSRCRGTVPSAYLSAVHATRGMVMVKPSGQLHSGFYRAGRRRRCQAFGSVYGQPALGQIEATACAQQGYSAEQILRVFYGSLSIISTGSCGAGSAPSVPSVPNTPSGSSGSCYISGVRGNCQVARATPDGSYYSSPSCSGTNVHCYIPSAAWGPCGGGLSGGCKAEELGCSGANFVAHVCPGPSNIQCCPSQSSSGGGTTTGSGGNGCTIQGAQGTCQLAKARPDGSYYSSASCSGTNIHCFIPTAAWGRCGAGVSGSCKATELGCSSGNFVAHVCPGPNNIQCCPGG